MKFRAITYDTGKDAANIAKHGVSLEDAAQLAWDEAVTWPDTRRDYQEARVCALAPMGSRVYLVVFVDRGKYRRIISLRKANRREVKRYVEAIS